MRSAEDRAARFIDAVTGKYAWAFALLVALTVVSLIWGVVLGIASADQARENELLQNTDPKLGKVFLESTIRGDYKYCDDSNLIYVVERQSTVFKNDAECS